MFILIYLFNTIHESFPFLMSLWQSNYYTQHNNSHVIEYADAFVSSRI